MKARRPMTLTEKILAKSFGKREVVPGEVGIARVDLLIIHDLTARTVIPLFEELEKEGAKVWDPGKVVAVWDHLMAPNDVGQAELHKREKRFYEKHNIKFYDMGRGGVCHQLFHEKGHVVPGDTIVGADSHTVTFGALGCFATGIGASEAAYVMSAGEMWMRVPKSIKIDVVGQLGDMVVGKDVFLHIAAQLGEDGAIYKAIEWGGAVVEGMSLDSRLTLPNMSVEIGAKNGIIEPNEETLAYVRSRSKKPFEVLRSDADAEWDEVFKFDVSKLEPQVAIPPSPANARPVSEVAGIKIDQAYIGTCTNGRLEDLRMAAIMLRGKKVHPNVRLIVFPASQEVYAQALKEGIISVFVDSDACIYSPGCGPCAGSRCGVLGSGEVSIATSNRNFLERGGGPGSKIYLANAAVAAASAVAGEIVDPRKLLHR